MHIDILGRHRVTTGARSDVPVEMRLLSSWVLCTVILMAGAGCSSHGGGTDALDSGVDSSQDDGTDAVESGVDSSQDDGTGGADSGQSPSPASLSASATDLARFGDVAVGQSSAEASFTIRNQGQQASAGLALASGNREFTIGTSGDCTPGVVLPPGASCTVGVSFTPTAIGERSGFIMFSAWASGGGKVALTGTGIRPASLGSRSPIAFSPTMVGETSKGSTLIWNGGQAASPPVTITLSGSNPGDFAVQPATASGDCKWGTTTLAPSTDSCTMHVTFTPTAAGTRYALATFSTATGSFGSVQLAAIGVSTRWTPASPPSRDGTATLLADGRVLLVGSNGDGWTAELYDPATDRWSASGSIAIAGVRDGYTVTPLGNGRVLASCCATSPSFSIGAIYDAASGTWSNLGSSAPSRGGSTAVLLADGKVLIVDYVNAVVYDPETGTSTPTDSVTLPHTSSDVAALLSNGEVLVTGSWGVFDELYYPATNSWTHAGPMRHTRNYPTATLLGNGKVLVTGGTDSPTTAELYDPATHEWSEIEGMWYGRHHHTATLMASGKVLITGGGTNIAELYDPSTNKWSVSGAQMLKARSKNTATQLANGKVLVTGEGSAELYDPAVDSSPATSSLATVRPVP